ncbi:MAG: hypothetical protein IT335_03850, partial [Thermomicrobiales bacterium]|nr:hypothetical protein [Thermomicrobiales bacterium]
ESRAATKPVSALGLPEDCILAAVLRGSDLMIPNPDTVLLPGDDVIALSHRRSEASLQAVLGS